MTVDELRARVGGDTHVEIGDDGLMIAEVCVAHYDASTSVVITT